ncbi:MAG TPA: Asd/ArgC dimerization domain-containing protein [Candidatus Acidoferrales bacterium]|nr:Asd/ArgC dimerization domain-containing protein [Candidatus Acidoferrales bacterium]
MPATPARAARIAIAGASSLRGKDLAELIQERSFPADDIRLIDDDVAAGTLTEAGGEPAVIQPVDDDSFERVDFAFFAGRPEFTIRHWERASRAGATVVDLSGAFVDLRESLPWIPALDGVLPPPQTALGKLFFSPPAATIVACTLAGVLASLDAQRMSIVLLQPVSERGQSGIEELESQTVNLLSFQPISQTVYDAQVAFNLLGRFGADSREQLGGARAAISRGVARYLAGRSAVPAIQLVQAPVFYSYAFTAFAGFGGAVDAAALERALTQAGVSMERPGDAAPSNVSVAGESRIAIAHVEADPGVANGWWLWGAADNVRLAAANALSIAEKLIAS